MLLALLIAQAQNTGTNLDQITGPVGAIAVLLAAVIYLQRELAAERKARNDLAERLTEQAEKMIPVLEACTRALARNEDRT